MTYENCMRLLKEAEEKGDKEGVKFWSERAAKKKPAAAPEPKPEVKKNAKKPKR